MSALKTRIVREVQQVERDKYAPPHDFEDAIHIYLASERESPVVVLEVDATSLGGCISFRRDVRDVIERVTEDPEKYLCVVTDDPDVEPPEGCRAVSQSEIDEWVERVTSSGSKFSLVMAQD